MFRSIYWKITIPFTLLILTSMGILGFYLVDSTKNIQINNLRSFLVKEAKLIADASLPGFVNPGEQNALNDLAKTAGKEINTRVTIIRQDGTVLGDSEENPLTMENHSTRPEVIGALATGIGESTRYSTTTGQNTMYVAVPVTNQGRVIGVARVSLPLTTVENSVNSATMIIIWTTAIVTFLVIITTILIARMIIRPVRELTRAAQEISAGKIDRQIQIKTNDEIGHLGNTFNKMSSNLKSMMGEITDESNKLTNILSNLADGIIMTDDQRHILLTNAAAGRLFNFDIAKAKGKSVIEVIRDHQIDDVLKECLRDSQEKTNQFDSLSGFFLRVIAMPLIARKLNGALLLFQDLTEMRNLQTMRRGFIGNISHELKTPLASIKAIVETLQDGAIDDKKLAGDFLIKVDNEVDRISQIVTELTELSRIETGGVKLRIEPANLNQLIEDVITHLSPQAARKELTILTELAPAIPSVQADRERIRQVIINIIHNAIKFTAAGGKVIISTKQSGESVVVQVTDNGIGISTEDLPHIFERFFKADRARSSIGTGLGLAIAKHTVQAHQGNIWVQSEEGKGSTFSFSIPIQPNP